MNSCKIEFKCSNYLKRAKCKFFKAGSGTCIYEFYGNCSNENARKEVMKESLLDLNSPKKESADTGSYVDDSDWQIGHIF